MIKKRILDLNLNYAHKNLSAAFRIISGILGTIILLAGVLNLLYNKNIETLSLINALINLIMGGVFIFLSTKFLPNFLKRFFTITEDELSFKTSVFSPKRTIQWKSIEEVEIDKTILKIQIEEHLKPLHVYLGIVSYQDFELLQKAIVDLCLDKEIDLK